MSNVRIVRAGAERIDELEPLWRALHGQHLSLEPRLPGVPVRSQDDAWPRRRRLYGEWLSEQDSFVLMAQHRNRPVGYALVHMHDADEAWDTGGRFGILESLAVLPELRGQGLGTRLMRGVFEELRKLEVTVLDIGVLATNEGAKRFYERLGFAPWLIQYLGEIPRDA
jgi:ribosomal protein S18 acetylase RimI-like enzyme